MNNSDLKDKISKARREINYGNKQANRCRNSDAGFDNESLNSEMIKYYENRVNFGEYRLSELIEEQNFRKASLKDNKFIRRWLAGNDLLK